MDSNKEQKSSKAKECGFKYVWTGNETKQFKDQIKKMYSLGMDFAEIYFELSKIINIILYEIDVEENL